MKRAIWFSRHQPSREQIGSGEKKFEQAIMARNMARNNSVMVVLP
jgi:uncharacterized protein (UPF0548 family)